jgi:membrane protein implicated in regulation of membrane protease activity
MYRNLIIATGVLLWTAVAIDLGLHFVKGDWIAVAVAAVVGVALVSLARARARRTPAEPALNRSGAELA